MRFDVPPPAAEAGFDARERNLAWGEMQCSHQNIEVSIIPIRHLFAFPMLGIELFGAASKFSMWRRTFRRGVEIFDVGHRKVGKE